MMGNELAEAGFLFPAFLAATAGALSFLSPCVLPIVPPYIAYLGGVSLRQSELSYSVRLRLLQIAAFFVLGLSTVFIFLGFTASALGRLFIQNQTLFSQISGAAITVIGLHFIGVFRLSFLERETRFSPQIKQGSRIGAYILGLAFAFGWTPCIGPQLGAILSLAATESSALRGASLLGIYALGLGVPFLLVAFFIGRAMLLLARLRPYMRLIEISMGGFLVLIGGLMFFGSFAEISFWLVDKFPLLGLMG